MKTLVAALLFAASLAPAAADEACHLDVSAAPAAPILFPGVVRGPASPQEVAAQTAIAVQRVHAPLSARYADLPRVFAFYVEGGARHGTIAAVVGGPTPDPGAAVLLASRHRDPEAPCAFVPWTIIMGAPEKPTS